MSEPYQIAALQPDGLPSDEAIPRVHQLLNRWGIHIAPDSRLNLHDTPDHQPEVEPVNDAEHALQRLIAWPTLGTLDYAGPEGIVTVSYFGHSGSKGLKCVLISALDSSVDRTDSLERYQRLGSDLHEKLPAKRTVMRWGLEMHGFRWEEEIERLRQGLIVGSYPLLDLHN